MPHILIDEQGHEYYVLNGDMIISKEDNGILVTGIPGWLCPILFETDTDSDGNLELVEARCLINEEGYSTQVCMSHFHDMGMTAAIIAYFKED